jgi:hypothetical protein
MNRIDKAIQEAGIAVDRVTAGTAKPDFLNGLVSKQPSCAEAFSTNTTEVGGTSLERQAGESATE